MTDLYFCNQAECIPIIATFECNMNAMSSSLLPIARKDSIHHNHSDSGIIILIVGLMNLNFGLDLHKPNWLPWSHFCQTNLIFLFKG